MSEPSDWHLGLRAWNLGEPPKAGRALTQSEVELTDLLKHVAAHHLTGPLLGPTGVLPRLVVDHLTQLSVDPMSEGLPLLENQGLADLECEIHRELQSLLDADMPDTARRQRIAESIADGIIGINLVLDRGRLRGVATTVWAVNAAARCNLPLAPRERQPILHSLQNEVLRATRSDLDAPRLAKRIHAEIKKGVSRSSVAV